MNRPSRFAQLERQLRAYLAESFRKSLVVAGVPTDRARRITAILQAHDSRRLSELTTSELELLQTLVIAARRGDAQDEVFWKMREAYRITAGVADRAVTQQDVEASAARVRESRDMTTTAPLVGRGETE